MSVFDSVVDVLIKWPVKVKCKHSHTSFMCVCVCGLRQTSTALLDEV